MTLDLSSLVNDVTKYGLEALIVLAVGFVIIRILIHIERKALEKSPLDESVYLVIIRFTKIILWVLLAVVILGTLHISLGPFIAVLGTVGAALALALRDSLSNVAGGIILLFTKPFSKGDEIQINNLVGVVDSIDILTTNMHSYDNKTIIIPNGTIVNTIVINATRNDMRRVDAEISVAYHNDIEHAKSVIMDVIRENPIMVMDPAPFIQLTQHGDNGMIFKVGVWCRTEDRFQAQRELMESIKNQFEREGIDIPYPHMDITVIS